MGTEYFKQSDTRVDIYCENNKDMFKKLKSNILTFYKKYMNEYSTKRLTKIGHIEENGYKFKGVTSDWLEDYNNIKYKVNGLELNSEELNKYMPTESIFIVSVVYSIYNDLKYITYLYNEGLTDKYMNDYAKNVDEVLSSDSDVLEIRYCRKFHSLGLAIPNLLISEYTKLYNQVVLVGKCKEFYSNINEDYTSYSNLPVKIINNINTQVMNSKIPASDKDMALLAKEFRVAYATCLAHGVGSVDSLLGMAKRKVFKTQAKNGLRLATEGEINSRVSQLMEEDEYLISETNYNYLLTFVYLCTGDMKILERCNNNIQISNLLNLDSRDMIRVATNYMNSSEFMNDLIAMQSATDIVYPSTAIDEIKDRGLDEKLVTVRSNLEKKEYLSPYETMVLDITVKGMKKKSLSEKQINVLNSFYQEIQSGNKKENLYNKEVENKIAACTSYFSYKNNTFITNLFRSVLQYKKCSEKQLKCINDEYDKMLEHQKSVLEQENQFVVKNYTERKDDENRAIQELEREEPKKKSPVGRKTKKEEIEQIPTVIFGDYIFEDVD